MQFDRRSLLKYSAAAGALGLAGPLARPAFAAREKELNILCWEGYNSDEVLDPFRRKTSGDISAESGTSDPDMINKLRAGEVNVWDVINVNQPWARDEMWPEGLIKPLPKDRFEPLFADMMAPFNKDYKWCYSEDGENLLGIVQRFGPFNFVVNTDKVSRATAEDEGFKLFNDGLHERRPLRHPHLRQLEHFPHVHRRRRSIPSSSTARPRSPPSRRQRAPGSKAPS